MFYKASVLITLLAASAQLVAANTPACLLAAINTQDNPADLQAICKNASEVQGSLSNTCGGNTQAAMSALKSVCQGAGVAVAAYSASASFSSASTSASGTMTASSTGGQITGTSTMIYTSHYYNSSCSCTKSTMVTGTAYLGPSGIVTGTSGSGSGTAQATGSASSGAGASSGSSSTAGAASGSRASGTATSSAISSSTGAAGRFEVAGLTFGAAAFAGLAMIL